VRDLKHIDFSSAFLRTVTFLHAPRWLFTMPSASRHCSMHTKVGHEPLSH